MRTVIAPSADLIGVRTAALELYAEQLREQECGALEDRQKRPLTEAVRNSFRKDRTLAEGYYDWVLYLLKLKDQISVGVDVGIQLSADEVDGLRSVEAAFQEFRREHPPCPRCGALNRSFAVVCWNCRTKMKE
ncbi:MAG TPA: hypothetical protein VN622_17685 [Clostridia bacterium]|nr:hypothetical protein [Clostridia bacterium]